MWTDKELLSDNSFKPDIDKESFSEYFYSFKQAKNNCDKVVIEVLYFECLSFDDNTYNKTTASPEEH